MYLKKKQKPILLVKSNKPIQKVVLFLEAYRESIVTADLFFDIASFVKHPS